MVILGGGGVLMSEVSLYAVSRCSIWFLSVSDAGLCCGSRLRKGEVFAYAGRNQSLKDLKSTCLVRDE